MRGFNENFYEFEANSGPIERKFRKICINPTHFAAGIF